MTPQFEADIAPLLAAHCLKCHGLDKAEGGLDLRRRSSILRGGDSGPAVVAEKPEESLLLQRIESGEMPPEGEPPTSDQQRAVLRRWIAAGAPAAQKEESAGGDEPAAARIRPEDREFWAFAPPQRPPVPAVKGTDRVRTPIDAFVLAQLEPHGMELNADAPRPVLLRRLCLDLLGLPPTPEQLAEFLQDDGPDAYERLVDRLLASPQYGERWGRHWLDVAGYADSDGYLAADRLRPEAWRYRDYVVQAHNADLPYDRFVREQLAGDELSDWRRAETLTDEVTRQLVATGFLRTAADPTYPGYTEPNEIHQVLSDTLQIVGSTFLGLTIHCARCHAHKFDPLSQRDYYALQSIFLPALDPARWQPSEVRGIPWATEAELARVQEQNQRADERLGQLNAALADLTNRFQTRAVRERLHEGLQPVHDSFSAATLDPGWIISFAGSAKTWRAAPRDGRLQVESIEGDAGYALVRLQRPAVLRGAFETTLRFRWESQDGEPVDNAAMQGLILNLRDAAGNLVAGAGYIDENNTARGSPISGISRPEDPLGGDIIDHHMRKHEQAVPPDEHARALAPDGEAVVTIRRDGHGLITTTFDAGRIRTTQAVANADPVTLVEMEFRRYVLTPGATFDGLSVDEFGLQPAESERTDTEWLEQLIAAIVRPEAQRSEEEKTLVARYAPRMSFSAEDLARRYPEFGDRAARLQAAIAAEQALKQTIVNIRGLLDLDDPPPAGRIYPRGDYNKPGVPVDSGVPEVLAPGDFRFHALGSYKTTGRRQAFAGWLTDPNHPLTARVHVNRLWAHHFGRGIVPTLANFGHTGARPSHPELLDWLATEFVRAGWSQKHMQRLIVTSSVYRQASAANAAPAAADPDNVLLGAWPARRVEGEVVRDSMLSVSGRLNQRMAGPPAAVVPQGDGSVLTNDDADGNRRSIYLMVRRSQHVTMLELFDTPVMEVNCPQRTVSHVPLQSLAMLHGPLAERSAQALAERLLREAGSDAERVVLAFRLLFSREPVADETQSMLDFVVAVARDQDAGVGTEAAGAGAPPAAHRAAWVQAALVLLNSNEFLFVE